MSQICHSCEKRIYDSRQASILYVKCGSWIHQKCAKLTDQQLDEFANKSLQKSFTCASCEVDITSKNMPTTSAHESKEGLELLFKSLEEKLHSSLVSLKEELKTEVVREIAQLKEQSAQIQGIVEGG